MLQTGMRIRRYQSTKHNGMRQSYQGKNWKAQYLSLMHYISWFLIFGSKFHDNEVPAVTTQVLNDTLIYLLQTWLLTCLHVAFLLLCQLSLLAYLAPLSEQLKTLVLRQVH